MLTQAGDGGLALQRPMPSDVIPIVDIGGERLPERLELPRGMLLVEVAHIVPERPLQFAIGLRVMEGGMDQPDTDVPAKGGEESPGEERPVVKQHRPGDRVSAFEN